VLGNQDMATGGPGATGIPGTEKPTARRTKHGRAEAALCVNGSALRRQANLGGLIQAAPTGINALTINSKMSVNMSTLSTPFLIII
jgi:hypothetical protein